MSTILVPANSLKLLYFLAICLGLLSAQPLIQLLTRLEIDKFDESMQWIASATALLGYRVGMLITRGRSFVFF